jgi:hypothetical protein
MTVHVGARVPEELADALEAVASQSRTSKSEILRELLSDALLAGDYDIPDHLHQQLRRDKLKRQNKLEWQRVHFQSNVADRFRQAFEQGDLNGTIGDASVESLRDIHVEDAKLLFEDDDEMREAAVEYVNAVAEHAREAADASEFDRLDPEEMFNNYTGVAVGTQREGTDVSKVVADANSRMNGHLTDLDAITTALSKDYGISTELARECVNYAAGRRDTIEGVEVDR